jgi:cell wall-associated NlpC family hydrolase
MTNDRTTYIEPAIQWALSQLGEKKYALLCLGFVEDAYEKPNGINLDGYSFAKEAAEAYSALDDGDLPPRGSWAFYDCYGTIEGKYQNWGHVGLSLGDGKVIHAWDTVREDDYLDVQKLSGGAGWTSPVYIGWAPLEAILVGMQVKEGSG